MKQEIVRHYFQVWRYRELVRNLVSKELKGSYSASSLGLIWSMIQPACMIMIYYVAFRYIFNMKSSNYLLMLMNGILPYNYFSASLMSSTASVIGNAHLIKKIHFPRIILPLSTVLYQYFVFIMALLVFFPISFFLGGSLHWCYILYPVIFVLQFLFTLGLCLMISALTVFYRDIKHILEILTLLFMWLSPVMYDFTKVSPEIQKYLYYNPVASYLLAYQDIVYRGEWPALATLALCFFWSLATMGIGIFVFRLYDPTFAEEV